MKGSSKIGIALWLLLCLLMLLPLAFSFLPSLSGKKLQGADYSAFKDVRFSLETIENGEFQSAREEQVRREIGLANTWIRGYNELNFKLFRHTTAEKLILGKNDCFYEEMYITEYLGHNYLGEFFIEKKVAELKRLQTLLKEKYGIELLLVFEPGKARFEPESIPDRYRPQVKATSNYEGFTAACDEAGIAYLDLNAYFSHLKPHSSHLLYSKYGVHWSSYGLWQAADTLSHFIENQCNINLPDIVHDGDSTSRFNKDLDFDLEPAMNLLLPLPHEAMNFPICHFDYQPEKHIRPRVFTIADSYYWSIWNSGISGNLFSHNTFWYYNQTVYPDIWEPMVWADKSKLKETIKNHDIILLMITDANLYNFGWNFIEEALASLDPTWKEDPYIAALNHIINFKENGKYQWYNNLLKRSQQQQIPFSDILKKEVESIMP
ncbi:MAG: hypothetical protein MJZ49_02415 [Bacteroidales bacterium]|nr:hypothetical protein [Bacteroidales bacterium]